MKQKKLNFPVVASVAPINQQKQNGLMTVKNLTDKSADLYIYGEIVDNTDWKWDESDVMPDDVRNALDQVDGLDELNIYINSPGGSVFSGMAIHSMLKRNKAYKRAYIDGVGASMASIIPFAADEVHMPSNAYLMIHNPLTFTVGNASELRETADKLDEIANGMAEIYMQNVKEGTTVEEIKSMMDKETWFTGEKAAEIFNVKIVEPTQIAACDREFLENYTRAPKKLLAKEPPKPKPQTPEPNGITKEEKIKMQNELDLLSL